MQNVVPIVQFTAPAKEKLKEAMKEQSVSNAYLRIDVYASGGCSCSGGFRYGMGLEDKARPEDIVEEVGDIKVVTDKNNVDILRGCKIDYSEDIQRRGFKIINPNVQAGGCGCGGH
jgi:iron-sulfur cluster assembly accessory protein